MLSYVSVLFLAVLAACDLDFGEYEPFCKGGQFDEYYIYDFLTGTVNIRRATLIRGGQLIADTGKLIKPGKCSESWYVGIRSFLNSTVSQSQDKVWSCDLELLANKTLDKNCKDEKLPDNIPRNYTGFFYKRDLDWEIPSLYEGLLGWLNEIINVDMTYDDKADALRYDSSNSKTHRNYLNLMRRSASKMGCGSAYCYDPATKMHKYRGLCLTNKPELQINDVVMKYGKGGCQVENKCPENFICTEDGLCLKDVPNPTNP